MEAKCSSETSVATQQNTRRHIPDDDTLHNHRCENFKLYTVYPLRTLGEITVQPFPANYTGSRDVIEQVASVGESDILVYYDKYALFSFITRNRAPVDAQITKSISLGLRSC
jgi:hypothetical protein